MQFKDSLFYNWEFFFPVYGGAIPLPSSDVQLQFSNFIAGKNSVVQKSWQ